MKEHAFEPTYASFLIPLAIHEKSLWTILAESRKNDSGSIATGFVGGKEEECDQGDQVRTARREAVEEAGFAPDDLEGRNSLLGMSLRTNYFPGRPSFKNYFNVLVLDTRIPIHVSKTKDTVRDASWVRIKDAEKKDLKRSHALALIELCYWVEDMAEDSANLQYMLADLSYYRYERPSKCGWNLVPKMRWSAA